MSHVDIIGGSVAALVAAEALLDAGRDVRVHVGGRTPLGGGFAPIDVAGHRVEVGCRLLELDYGDPPTAPPPLGHYRPGPHGHRPWINVIDRWVRERVAVEEVPAHIWHEHRGAADFVFSGDLSSLPDLVDPATLAVIAAESADAVRRLGPHGAGAGPASFGDVALAQTGATFHSRFVGALAAKILPGQDVAASLHRKLWLPLFRPETVHQAATGALTYRPRRPLHSGVGDLVAGLVAKLRPAMVDSGKVLSITARRVRLERATFENTSTIVSAGELNTPRRRMATTQVAWFECGDEPCVSWITDRDTPIYRVTRNGTVAMMEMTPGRVPRSAATIGRLLDVKQVSFPIGPYGPPPIEVPATVVGWDSFNEQVIQGLKAAE